MGYNRWLLLVSTITSAALCVPLSSHATTYAMYAVPINIHDTGTMLEGASPSTEIAFPKILRPIIYGNCPEVKGLSNLHSNVDSVSILLSVNLDGHVSEFSFLDVIEDEYWNYVRNALIECRSLERELSDRGIRGWIGISGQLSR